MLEAWIILEDKGLIGNIAQVKAKKNLGLAGKLLVLQALLITRKKVGQPLGKRQMTRGFKGEKKLIALQRIKCSITFPSGASTVPCYHVKAP